MSMHMIRGVQVHGKSKLKRKNRVEESTRRTRGISQKDGGDW